MLAWKKAKRWILMLLLCVLFIGLIPGRALAVSYYWEYNGVFLPALPAAASSYPYACISFLDSDDPDKVDYRLVIYDTVSTLQASWGYDALTMPGVTSGTWKGYYYNVGETDEWQYSETWSGSVTGSSGKYILPVVNSGWSFVWSNVDLYNESGVMVYAGTEPGVTEFPETPRFRVNLPSNYVYQYTLNETPAQLYVDAYVNNASSVLVYAWQRYYDGEWLSVDGGSGQYYTPSTAAEGVVRYRCTVENTNDEMVSVAVSNAVYVVVGESTIIPDDETGTISPGDQVMIDQMGQIKDDVGGIKDSVEQLPEDIQEGMQEVADNERQEAETEGNELIDEMTAVIPDISNEGQASLRPLLSAISYEGRDPVLTMPALVLPSVGGLWEETILLPAQNIEFSGYVELIPIHFRVLVQVICMIAAVLFVIRDIYGLVQYFATLRGGTHE